MLNYRNKIVSVLRLFTEPSTPKTMTTDETEKEIVTTKSKSYMPLIASAAAVGLLLLLAMILACFCVKRKRNTSNDGNIDRRNVLNSILNMVILICCR